MKVTFLFNQSWNISFRLVATEYEKCFYLFPGSELKGYSALCTYFFGDFK